MFNKHESWRDSASVISAIAASAIRTAHGHAGGPYLLEAERRPHKTHRLSHISALLRVRSGDRISLLARIISRRLKKMNMPGFTAETSLLLKGERFVGHGLSDAWANQIVPAFPCCEGCAISCGIYYQCTPGGSPIDPNCTYASRRCSNCLRWCRPCPGLSREPVPQPDPVWGI